MFLRGSAIFAFDDYICFSESGLDISFADLVMNAYI